MTMIFNYNDCKLAILLKYEQTIENKYQNN